MFWKNLFKKKPIPQKPLTLCLSCGQSLNNNQKMYCCLTCRRDHEYDEYLLLWKVNFESGITDSGTFTAQVRRYIWHKYKGKCSQCGWAIANEFTGKPNLEIDHINGNPYDNRESNLRLLCKNCHSLTPTYGSLNNGKGRKSRKHIK